MKKARFEWVMSGLIHYALTEAEDHFLKTASADFVKNRALTKNQEERLESLYKEKSQRLPEMKAKPSSLKKSGYTRTRTRRPRAKLF
jgi:hypothetical protein